MRFHSGSGVAPGRICTSAVYFGAMFSKTVADIFVAPLQQMQCKHDKMLPASLAVQSAKLFARESCVCVCFSLRFIAAEQTYIAGVQTFFCCCCSFVFIQPITREDDIIRVR